MPLENACANTTTSGSTTNTERNVTASAMMTSRTGAGSVRGLPTALPARGRTRSAREDRGDSARSVVGAKARNSVAAVTTLDCVDIGASMRRNTGLRPALEAIDRKDDQERRQQHHHGY